ncbi:DHH family phosphoesterase [Clostridium sp.]|uniref:DHH family phosphoesterase n=1 Tax=Clostridium sp. TaxID=1506 RepID=UPI002FDE014D
MDNKYNYFITENKIYMVSIAALIFILFLYGHIYIGGIAIALYGLLVLYNVKNTKQKKYEWKKFIEDFSSKLDLATRNTLVKLPFPLIIIGNKGNILWYNQNLSSILDGSDIFESNINDVLKDFNLKLAMDGKKTVFKYVKLNEKYFNIYTNLIDLGDYKNLNDKIMLLYFYDVTDVFNLINSVESNKEAVMLIEVDNLDEVIKSTEEDKKPLLIAEIERTINSYAQGLNAMVKKYSSNKYVLTLQNKYVEEEMKKRFEILDSMREISMGNKLTVTLSVGVGRNGGNPFNNESYAVSAKELALGRGGDQAIVKSGEKLDFYGGKTREIEKRTKVRSRVIAHALVDLINESSNVYIHGHINPDIDCLGAAVGIYSTIKALNKECYIVLDGTNNSIKGMMDKLKSEADYDSAFIDSKKCMETKDDNSLLIVLDVHNKGYVQNLELVESFKKLVIIDHHRKSTDYLEGALLSYIEPYASSTCELVTEMIQYMLEKPKLKPVEAEALLAGICVDTKNFYFKTGVRTFEAASFLRKLGADTIDVKKLFSDDLDTYLKRADIIKSAVVKNNIAIAVCPPEIEDTVLAAQAADELLNITGIQASFVFVTIGEDIYISGRSLGDINVQIILETLGGGGHMTMAGTKISDKKLEEAVELLKQAIEKYLREGE